MCGPRARTNFPYNPNAPQTTSSKLLSATLTAKLHRCYMASLQLTKNTVTSAMQPQHRGPAPQFPGPSRSGGQGCHRYGSAAVGPTQPGPGPNWVVKVESDQLFESQQQQLEQQKQEFEPLEEDDIEQMIQELLDYGPIEIAI